MVMLMLMSRFLVLIRTTTMKTPCKSLSTNAVCAGAQGGLGPQRAINLERYRAYCLHYHAAVGLSSRYNSHSVDHRLLQHTVIRPR